MSDRFKSSPLDDASFGAALSGEAGAQGFVAAAEADPTAMLDTFYAADGLLLVPGMQGITSDPGLLLRLSRLFGPEVENYDDTLMSANQIHPDVREIFIVSNAPPVDRPPPPLPEPPLTEDGRLPVQFPHRRGWHTDQSYRRPPPDVSLFLAVIPAPEGQGQTLFADGRAAYAALTEDMKARIEGMDGIHAKPRTGRSEREVLAGEQPHPTAPHERPQRQPLVRQHPVTGEKSLYLCEGGQMDWADGPIAGMAPGPGGDGAKLLYELMSHMTSDRFTYAHHWRAGDLVIWDNRSLLHSATWFDTETCDRVMWRTTVHGNPGSEYAGEAKSWVPAA